jgi:hypothetical protein
MNIRKCLLWTGSVLMLINLQFGNELTYKVIDTVFKGEEGRQIVRISCEVRCTTMFILPEQEMVADIIEPTGDWIVNCDSRRYIYVVPLKRGIHTSLDIVTGASRVYSFILEEVSGRARPTEIVKKVLIRDSFYLRSGSQEDRGGRDCRAGMSGRPVYKGYKIEDRHFKISGVEDDGIVTRVYMGGSQVRPAVFLKEGRKSSRYEPVRYRDTGDHYLIQRVLGKNESFVLKTGKKESTIRRK